MFLREKTTSDLVEVLDIEDLVDPTRDRVTGRFHAGEEMQEPRAFAKAELRFPSDEPLPRCWIDPHYRG